MNKIWIQKWPIYVTVQAMFRCANVHSSRTGSLSLKFLSFCHDCYVFSFTCLYSKKGYYNYGLYLMNISKKGLDYCALKL